ncbi:hypothetical protein GBA52_005938 [Prunus armeniaca]|nr:hypothetical protein GBA52_005938 [Prunus armeniaca]
MDGQLFLEEGRKDLDKFFVNDYYKQDSTYVHTLPWDGDNPLQQQVVLRTPLRESVPYDINQRFFCGL